MSSQPFADFLPDAQTRFVEFWAAVPRDAHIVVFCHFDADGLAAGALFGRLLPHMGYTDVHVEPSGKGENAFTDAARKRIGALKPDALVVTDLGVSSQGVLLDVPTLYVDHHLPTGEPSDATVITGYGVNPIPNSAWLTHELFRPFVDEEAHAAVDWVAAVGTLSDLGDKAPWPLLAPTKKRFTAKWLKEAVVLCNAARRAPAFDVATPLRILMTADHPRAFGDESVEGTDRLARYRKQVNTAVRKARRVAPTFSETRPVALLEIDSPCQIHPLIAQQWRGRLPTYAVIAANKGYMPGVIAFSSRTKIPGFSLPEMYRSVDLGAELNAQFGNGHDQASGGHLPPEAFERLLAGLGFERERDAN